MFFILLLKSQRNAINYSEITSKSLSETMESLPNICGFLCFNPFCERVCVDMKVDRSCSKLKHLGISGYQNYITDSTVHDTVQSHPCCAIANIFILLFATLHLSF